MRLRPTYDTWDDASKDPYSDFIGISLMGLCFLSLLIWSIIMLIEYGFSARIMAVLWPSCIGVLIFFVAYASLKTSREQKGRERIDFNLGKVKSHIVERDKEEIYKIIKEIFTDLGIKYIPKRGESHFNFYSDREYVCKNNYTLAVGTRRRGELHLIFLIGPITDDNKEEIRKVQGDICEKVKNWKYVLS